MTKRLLVLVPIIVVACNTAAGPNALPEGPADFQGTIAQISVDGYVVDDGSASACGFTRMRVSNTTELWWRVGGRARASDLRVGRAVSLWHDDAGSARCSTVQARAVVIEQFRN